MQQQNYKNHIRFYPLYHFITAPAILALIIGSFINLYNSAKENLYSASLICLISLILFSLFFLARSFALKAQDRAIRAEENFRHFFLTNRSLDIRLTMQQVIALRFASDEEFPALAIKAAENNLTGKQIKMAVKSWRPDYYRA